MSRSLQLVALTALILGACSPRADSPSTIPQRIVSTAPSLTEMLFALGAGDRIVGVTSFCTYPPEALGKTRIGSYASPSIEAIVAQRPDLVVIQKERIDLAPKLKGVGLPVLALDHHDLPGILGSIQQMAEAVGTVENGHSLRDEIQSEIDSIRLTLADTTPPTVLFLVGRNPGSLSDIYAAGKGSYIDELIGIAGGRNVFSNSLAAYPKVSFEEILARSPEVILDFSHGDEVSEEQIAKARELWGQYDSIKAVSEGRVFVLTQGILLVPGPRVGQAVREIASFIHGERSR